MSYYFSKMMNCSVEEAVEKVTAKLKEYGFGIITQVNVQETLKEKIGVEFRKYRILGACNPAYAHRALSAESRIGLLLPCNVIVYEREDGKTEVAAINPKISMEKVGNKELSDFSCEVTEIMEKVIKAL
ncbi:hypothetical protein SDC9_21777 [bioreactor metagenome]|uniref:DUF302 domain-containing protein n=1 Tax=bioreactor metagenome TaxID=1076179 RepID=A0A644UAP4_9ZZZZ|nr:DUF302 domain-containing protein [Lentimicrobium sp.]MEA5109041.1 DUF302 domain-containing protein [Lentimicrobium sp.]HCT70148.1 hypothetical protein [Bacteroidales bacterium]